LQVRGFAPIGILEFWNDGMMGLRYCNVGFMSISILMIKFGMDKIL
jgi:hypothetical protein